MDIEIRGAAKGALSLFDGINVKAEDIGGLVEEWLAFVQDNPSQPLCTWFSRQKPDVVTAFAILGAEHIAIALFKQTEKVDRELRKKARQQARMNKRKTVEDKK